MIKIEGIITDGATVLSGGGGLFAVNQYTGYADEILASKDTAYIGTVLMVSPIYDVSGPDAVKFLNSICINNFSNLGDKGLRHAVICNDKGQIMTDGVVIRIAEDTYRTYWLQPVIDYLLQTSGMNVQGKDISGSEYFYQIAGPKSLEILEDACGCDLHDIKFAKHRMVKINGKDMRVIRLGMAGNLAYEVHGDIADYEEIYEKIWESGKKFGAKKLGLQAYMMNHTEGGFPNINMHYPLPWYEDEGLAAYLNERPFAGAVNNNRKLVGSVGNELDSRFVTPYDVGWDFLVNFNHDFIGREALEKIANNPPRTVVTLEWNSDDIGEIYTSQFRGKDSIPYDRIDVTPCDYNPMEAMYHADKIYVNNEQIGISSGRTNSYYYNAMISLGFIRKEYAVEGNEVSILWGSPGTPQKEIRAKIVRLPYNDLVRNEDTDVEMIPHYKG